MKSQVPIDQLLVWAFRDGAPDSWRPNSVRTMFSARFFELGTVIDAAMFSRSDYIDDRHPDAVRVQEAVFKACQLGRSTLDLKNDCTFFLGQLAIYVRDEDFGPVPSVNPGALVLQHAILGGYPKWNFGQPRLTKIIGANGQAVMLGRLVQKCQYTNGSICPLELQPSPREIALARHDYHTWWEALRDLRLPDLQDHTPMPPNAPFAPWIIKQPSSHCNSLITENFSTSQNSSLCRAGA